MNHIIKGLSDDYRDIVTRAADKAPRNPVVIKAAALMAAINDYNARETLLKIETVEDYLKMLAGGERC
jgi:hypothetical protein